MELTDAVLVALIASVPPTLAAFGAMVVGILNSRKIKEVHDATNGMKDELVRVNRSDAQQIGEHAGRVAGRMQGRTQGLQEGIAVGRADERERFATGAGELGPPETRRHGSIE